MKIITGIGKALPMGLIGLASGLLGGKKKPVLPQPIPQRDDAAAAIAADDELRRRRGASADIITGIRGAEALPTAGRLVQSN